MRHSRDTSPRRSRTRGLVASFAAVAVGMTGLVAVATSASASATTCDDTSHPNGIVTGSGWLAKVNTVGDPATVPYVAPAGYLVDVFCVAAGGGALIIDVTPDAASIVVDHPSVNSVSHYRIHLVPIPATEVTPAAPTFAPPTCDAAGSLNYSNGAGYTWAESGTESATTLTATATAGYVLTGQTIYGPYDLTQLTGEICLSEQPREVEVDPAVFTAPTCEAGGTLVGVDTEDYEWTRTGPDTAAVLAVSPIGDVTLTGTTAYGPYDLTQLTGEICLSGTPIIPETPITPQAPVTPTVVTQAALAETGLPLLGLLGLAGSFSLIGGGLLNARRLLTGRH